VIENHKKKVGLLPKNYVSSQSLYKNRWKTLKHDILKSYEFHPYVRLTILGGEPLYNKDVINFLNELVMLGLSTRTKLEFLTNATVLSPKIRDLLDKKNWNYTVALLSLDAVGKKAEWLRYGCNWKKIVNNVRIFKELVNHIEVNCTLGILNIMDLPELKRFCDQQNIQLLLSPMQQPDFMALESWPLPPEMLVSQQELDNVGFGKYYNLVGKTPDPTAPEKLKNYIKSFNNVRTPLSVFDPKLAKIFGVD
jgi:MoaA/NifB/PqqE/SkfB family radical SAM enzyme